MDYKEKLEEAKRLYETANQDQRYVLESLFPELKESEDERIRKELINFVENWRNHNPNSPFDDYPIYTSDERECNKILVWLKKQGEHKPAWNVEDELVVKDAAEAVTNYWYGQSQEDLLDWLKSLKQRIGG